MTNEERLIEWIHTCTSPGIKAIVIEEIKKKLEHPSPQN